MFSKFREIREAFSTNRLLKLDDVSGEMILADSELVPKIRSLSNMEKLNLLPVLVHEILKGVGSELTAIHLEKLLNTVKGRTVKPTLPVFATGQLKQQEILQTETGVLRKGSDAILLVELKDLTKFGSVGLRTKILNLSVEDKADLLLLLEHELECSGETAEEGVRNDPK